MKHISKEMFVIKEQFPDLISFIQATKVVFNNSEKFNLSKSQYHRLRKIITKARSECSQQEVNFLTKECKLSPLEHEI